SMSQKDTLAVLLTGRSVAGFSKLIMQILTAKKLEFDMVCLKPSTGPSGESFASTKDFKTKLLSDIMDTYVHTDELTCVEWFWYSLGASLLITASAYMRIGCRMCKRFESSSTSITTL